MSGLSSTHTAATSSGAMSVVAGQLAAEAEPDGSKKLEVLEALAANMQHATRSVEENDLADEATTAELPPSSLSWGLSRERRSGSKAVSLRSDFTTSGPRKPSPKQKPKLAHQCPSCTHTIECGRHPGLETLGDALCAQCQSYTNSAEHTCPQCHKSFCRACIRARQPERAMSRLTLSSGASTVGRGSPLQAQMGEDTSPIPDDEPVKNFLRASTIDSLRNSDSSLRDAVEGNRDSRAAIDMEEGIWT